jgi:hypothetical protein
LDRLREDSASLSSKKRFARRHARLEKKTRRAEDSRLLPASGGH